MVKQNLLLRNPLRSLGYIDEDIIPGGSLGAVLAPAGVGKTAFLVQIALHAMLRGKNVLHVSLHDQLSKVELWYKEIFEHLAAEYDAAKKAAIWEELSPRRFIMSFRVEGFSVPTLEERMTDLIEQGIFLPKLMVVDGLKFDETAEKTLSAIACLASGRSMQVWFSVHTHRHEECGSQGIPPYLRGTAELLSAIIKLQPQDGEIFVEGLKGMNDHQQGPLILDPATMLLKK
ncbi:MAG: AAA family ATPase [Smithellaceae bacterium]|nr:AAA family ATPase [Smithellaceae bacterium]